MNLKSGLTGQSCGLAALEGDENVAERNRQAQSVAGRILDVAVAYICRSAKNVTTHSLLPPKSKTRVPVWPNG